MNCKSNKYYRKSIVALALAVCLLASTAIPAFHVALNIKTAIAEIATAMVSAGNKHTVGLKSDGTVVAVGMNGNGQCDVSGWSGIQQVSAGGFHTVGLKSDGTVVAVGMNGNGQCDVSGWSGIQQVSAGVYHTVGLKSDGTVVAVGMNGFGQCEVSGWSGIQQVSAAFFHTVGLKSDGTVVAVGSNDDGQCGVSGWSGIQQVSAGYFHTVGLKTDGTVVAVGNNGDGQCSVSGWSGIQQVSAGYSHTVGLKSDGTVMAVGSNNSGECDVSGWSGIQQVSVGLHTVGLKSDGAVVAVGRNTEGQCDVSSWDLIVQPIPPAGTHTWSFCSSGFLPQHLPDSYTGEVVLDDLVDVPDEVQGIYLYDCTAHEWKFWAPGAPGCTLTNLGGGQTYDYQVAVTGDCDWGIPIDDEIPTPMPPPAGPHNWDFCSSGFFARHLPDGYAGEVVLGDLVAVPDEVQGVYWYDCNSMGWKFWAPGAPGCTLANLGGGQTYDYQVAVTGDCDWSVPLP